MHYDRLVHAYHGTSRATAAALLDGSPFLRSANAHDWLGPGIYFWEHGLDRAARWAREHGESDPTVVGALVQLGKCYDLMDTRYTEDLAVGAIAFHEKTVRAGAATPRNRGTDGKARYLDSAVLTWWLDELAEAGQVFQTVRYGFEEGPPVHPDMAIRSESHVQIAVRDPACIIGVFRPTPTSSPQAGIRRTPG